MIYQIKLISIIFLGIILSLQDKVKSHEIKLPTHNYHCPKLGSVSITEAKLRKDPRDWGSELEYIRITRGNRTLEFDALIKRKLSSQVWITAWRVITYYRFPNPSNPYQKNYELFIEVHRNYNGLKSGIYKCKFLDVINDYE